MEGLADCQGQQLKFVLGQVISTCATSQEFCELLIREKILTHLCDIYRDEDSDMQTKMLCEIALDALNWGSQYMDKEEDFDKILLKLREITKSDNQPIAKRARRELNQIIEQEDDYEQDLIEKIEKAESHEQIIAIQLEKIEKQINEDQLNLKLICKQTSDFLLGKEEQQKLALEAGVVDVLIRILSSAPLEKVELVHLRALAVFTSSSDEIINKFVQKKPYPLLFRLLQSSFAEVVNKALKTIYKILLSGNNSTQSSSIHPHFETVAQAGGIDSLIEVYEDENNGDQYRNIASMCLAMVYRRQEIKDAKKKRIIILHLIPLLRDPDKWTRQAALKVLNGLALNSANLSFIRNQRQYRMMMR
ncbi:MAG: hypothetical protein EZS28_022161 [Streblomastix strix]|uniref:Uncharacterized protein n=1 Tax=Streblomastix strix TaxID=222440 RepID=A0A5J4VIB6_9EUKA|nr:MAG: hypothetical protein EZS28_022161 [Streblomastix strix]